MKRPWLATAGPRGFAFTVVRNKSRIPGGAVERTSYVVCPYRNVPAAYRHFFPGEKPGLAELLMQLREKARGVESRAFSVAERKLRRAGRQRSHFNGERLAWI